MLGEKWKIIGVGLLLYLFVIQASFAQTIIKGQVKDQTTNEAMFGASVIVEGTTTGTQTDFDGKFELEIKKDLPLTIKISFLGYDDYTHQLTEENKDQEIKVKLKESSVSMDVVEVKSTRLTQKEKESPLTVETMGITAIKENTAADFYEGLGQLKGVDLTSASIGFKVINTRGFNSTSPVRSLQLIDGVDNQSPGLNFSLGNFLGTSELDIQKVDLIQGASSAFYGPNAFNGVIDMRTRDPFIHQGLSAQVKYGERNLFQGAMRYAKVFQNKEGEDKFAFKLNFSYLRADDWEATNYDPATDSEVGRDNLGGYDAVNIYGDEDLAGGNDFRQNTRSYPGLGIYYRDGYREEDILDYETKNTKASMGLFYKIKSDLVLNYNLSYGGGTTVYQGENRFSLKNIHFYQNKLELSKKDKWFVRAYSTNERAGDTYDGVVTAFIMQDAARSNTNWNRAYSSYWNRSIVPRFNNSEGFPQLPGVGGDMNAYNDSVNMYVENNRALFEDYHTETRDVTNNSVRGEQMPYAQPGTEQFDSLFNVVTSNYLSEGGSRFYDRSALYHLHGEYTFEPKWTDNIKVGANGRLFAPNSRGTIFQDTIQYAYDTTFDASNNMVIDTSSEYNRITNFEFGVYAGIDKSFLHDQLKASFTIRVDKNQNFNFLVSPALSLVYNLDENNTFRLSFSSAIRNPTLSDQYLNFNVGRAVLLGNLNGFDSLITVESFQNYINVDTIGFESLEFFNVDPIRPEQVRTIELGYRGQLFGLLYIDASYYHSWYKDFIGFKLGIDTEFDNLGVPNVIQAYRVSANSDDIVTTQGFSIAANYYVGKYFNLTGNYSWNRLDLQGSDDEIIPAFNTPEHKFNLGFSGRNIIWNFKNRSFRNFGFAVNYKWIQGFLFEGSPQFTGQIPTYDMLDIQINKTIPKIYTTVKIGVSNLMGITPLVERDNGDIGNRFSEAWNNNNFQVYGGPRVGRLAYISLLFEIDKF
ncbi:MAG: TonB-dependent receptor [Chitinophagales bacterium]